MNKKFDFLDILFWASLGLFMLWAILKSIGIIKSPVWLEIGLPAIAAGIAIRSFYQRFKKMEKDAEKISGKTNKIFEKCPIVKN